MVVLLQAVTASYAEQAKIAKRLSFKIGVFEPASTNLRNTVGSSWLDARVGYIVSSTDKADSIVELGWTGKNNDILGEEYKFRIIPLTYTYKVKTPSKFYYGGGAGVYYAKSEYGNDIFGSSPFSVYGTDTEYKFGLHAVTGYSFTDSLNAELCYTQVLSKFEDNLELSGFSAYLSGKF